MEWCCRTGLNCRPLPYQGSALPLSYGSIGSVLGKRDIHFFSSRARPLYDVAAAGDPARRRGLLCHRDRLDARPKTAYQPDQWNRGAEGPWANRNKLHCASKDWPQSCGRTSSVGRNRQRRALQAMRTSRFQRHPERTRTRNRKPFSGDSDRNIFENGWSGSRGNEDPALPPNR